MAANSFGSIRLYGCLRTSPAFDNSAMHSDPRTNHDQPVQLLGILLCDFEPNDDGWKCRTCGQRMRTTKKTPRVVCRASPIQPRRRLPVVAPGPGTELTKLFTELGVKPTSQCSCEELATQMNRWGPAGCREHRQEIIGRIKANWQAMPTGDKLWSAFAGIKAAATGVASISDPIGSLVDKAIERGF